MSCGQLLGSFSWAPEGCPGGPPPRLVRAVLATQTGQFRVSFWGAVWGAVWGPARPAGSSSRGPKPDIDCYYNPDRTNPNMRVRILVGKIFGPDGPGRNIHPSRKVGGRHPFTFKGHWARLGPAGPPKSTISGPNVLGADRAQKPYTDALVFALLCAPNRSTGPRRSCSKRGYNEGLL